MIRLLFALFALILLVVVGGMLVLGGFPPGPHTQQVEHVLPNDKFKSP